MPRKKQTGLMLINLRLRANDVDIARRQASALGIPYQHVIRAWVAQGAASQNTLVR